MIIIKLQNFSFSNHIPFRLHSQLQITLNSHTAKSLEQKLLCNEGNSEKPILMPAAAVSAQPWCCHDIAKQRQRGLGTASLRKWMLHDLCIKSSIFSADTYTPTWSISTRLEHSNISNVWIKSSQVNEHQGTILRVCNKSIVRKILFLYHSLL